MVFARGDGRWAMVAALNAYPSALDGFGTFSLAV
jgi:hypothetical protein